MSDLYNANDIVDKTLIALKRLPVYTDVPRSGSIPKAAGYTTPNQPIGVVYSYINADPIQNRGTLWWMFWPGQNYGGNYFYIPHNVGDFDVSSLKQQGVLTLEEQRELEEQKNKEWYEKIVDRIIPVGVAVILGGAVIKGLLSRKN